MTPSGHPPRSTEYGVPENFSLRPKVRHNNGNNKAEEKDRVGELDYHPIFARYGTLGNASHVAFRHVKSRWEHVME